VVLLPSLLVSGAVGMPDPNTLGSLNISFAFTFPILYSLEGSGPAPCSLSPQTCSFFRIYCVCLSGGLGLVPAICSPNCVLCGRFVVACGPKDISPAAHHSGPPAIFFASSIACSLRDSGDLLLAFWAHELLFVRFPSF
jgi:hypothetical protein